MLLLSFVPMFSSKNSFYGPIELFPFLHTKSFCFLGTTSCNDGIMCLQSFEGLSVAEAQVSRCFGKLRRNNDRLTLVRLSSFTPQQVIRRCAECIRNLKQVLGTDIPFSIF